MTSELEIAALRDRIGKLEARMHFLYKHFGVSFVPEQLTPGDPEEPVAAFLKKGDMLGALQAYRGIHHVGMEEAKAGVDELKARLGL